MANYSIYIHIPFCRARCSYCAFSSCTDLSLQEAYFAKLFDEISACELPEKHIGTVFLGGGTPSAVDGKYIVRLFDLLRSRFDLADDCEITTEGNPESATNDKLALFRDVGINRISFGLQSLSNATLAKIGRLHTSEQFLQVLDNALAVGFTNINADLMLGLPESHADFLHTVDSVVQLPLSHLSLYALELYPYAPLYALRNQIPSDQDYLADLYDQAVARFAEAGFMRYETSNFARDGKRCKHNLNYWHEGRYYGFGASASGFVSDVRYDNVRDIRDYIAADNVRVNAETESLDTQANEYVMLALRLADGVDLAEFRARYGRDFFTYFDSANRLLQQGCLQVVGGSVVIPDDKYYVANAILSELVDFDD